MLGCGTLPAASAPGRVSGSVGFRGGQPSRASPVPVAPSPGTRTTGETPSCPARSFTSTRTSSTSPGRNCQAYRSVVRNGRSVTLCQFPPLAHRHSSVTAFGSRVSRFSSDALHSTPLPVANSRTVGGVVSMTMRICGVSSSFFGLVVPSP